MKRLLRWWCSRFGHRFSGLEQAMAQLEANAIPPMRAEIHCLLCRDVFLVQPSELPPPDPVG